jgi:hypothetical protein
VELDAAEWAEVVGVELVDGTDLGRGWGRQTERGYDRSR